MTKMNSFEICAVMNNIEKCYNDTLFSLETRKIKIEEEILRIRVVLTLDIY